jgi:hypothetical protein
VAENAVLWLFVIFGGIAVGAGLYEMRITVPRWFPRAAGSTIRVDADAMRTDDAGRRFWVFVTTGPLTLLTIASLVMAWGGDTAVHRWWLAGAAITAVERAATLGYFIPRAVKLLDPGRLPAEKAQATARQWMRLNHGRAALALLGWLAALKALSMSGPAA